MTFHFFCLRLSESSRREILERYVTRYINHVTACGNSVTTPAAAAAAANGEGENSRSGHYPNFQCYFVSFYQHQSLYKSVITVNTNSRCAWIFLSAFLPITAHTVSVYFLKQCTRRAFDGTVSSQKAFHEYYWNETKKLLEGMKEQCSHPVVGHQFAMQANQYFYLMLKFC